MQSPDRLEHPDAKSEVEYATPERVREMTHDERRIIEYVRPGRCSRCPEAVTDEDAPSHDEVYAFAEPMIDPDGSPWEWYGICPITGDPFLIANRDKMTPRALAQYGAHDAS